MNTPEFRYDIFLFLSNISVWHRGVPIHASDVLLGANYCTSSDRKFLCRESFQDADKFYDPSLELENPLENLLFPYKNFDLC